MIELFAVFADGNTELRMSDDHSALEVDALEAGGAEESLALQSLRAKDVFPVVFQLHFTHL